MNPPTHKSSTYTRLDPFLQCDGVIDGEFIVRVLTQAGKQRSQQRVTQCFLVLVEAIRCWCLDPTVVSLSCEAIQDLPQMSSLLSDMEQVVVFRLDHIAIELAIENCMAVDSLLDAIDMSGRLRWSKEEEFGDAVQQPERLDVFIVNHFQGCDALLNEI